MVGGFHVHCQVRLSGSWTICCPWQHLQKTERRTIMAEITWVPSFVDGLAQAKANNKLALVDFFNPG
jgi:hypothetical protein